MPKIVSIAAREILNAKGIPTIETKVETDTGIIGVASVPSGTSIGKYEAYELRDADMTRYQGNGVLKAIQGITQAIAPKLIGMDVTSQPQIDEAMRDIDGSENKAKLGANAILSVSIACTKAAARAQGVELYEYLHSFTQISGSFVLPTPLFNIINGGKHGIDSLEFQEFIVMPATSKSFDQAMEMGVNCYMALKELLIKNNLSTLVGDEGGFGPRLSANKDALLFVSQAIDKAGYKLGLDGFLGIDCAASTFYKDKKYTIHDKPTSLSNSLLNAYYVELVKKFHILYLEDPMEEDDMEGWKNAYDLLSSTLILAGDDLVATNLYRLQMILEKKLANAIIIKPNQIGTVMEALAVAVAAKDAGLKIIVSHRSGETNDDFIADFALAVHADYVKFGAPARGERVAKYNRLLQLDEMLKKKA